MDARDYAIVALDFETSGYYRHSACSIGMCRIENLEIVQEYASLIRPPSSDVKFSHIHGLYWRDLQFQRNFSAVWPEISAFMQGADFLLAHNARFDRGVLYACCNFFRVPRPGQAFICSLKGSRRKLSLRSNSLDNVCKFLNIPLNHHKADSDARACAMIAIHLLSSGLSIEEMLLN